MPLSPGDRLGPYEIVALLGAGGMGEVYRARDPRLDRTVAIKVLPPDRTGDPDRQQRFEREARAVAALSHPNICAIHDVGREGEISFLVMEYLDGETLAGRIARSVGPGGTPQGLPVAETLAIAAQIATGLAAAHRAGIVHRDLKPANVVLTRSGAKILDFGLARVAAGPQAPGLASGMLTQAAPLTGVGTLLGTVPYMSPEQVEGKEVDARSDIFSLGSVVYEMATGRRAFDGGSQASLIAAILERQPAPMTQVQPLTPPGLERIVRACIAKAPEDRWQYVGDVARQLSWLGGEIESGVASTPSGPVSAHASIPAGRRRRLSWPAALLGTAAIAGAALVASVLLGRAPARGAAPDALPIHFALSVPGVSVARVQVSPDGRSLAIDGRRSDGTRGTWIHRLDDARAVEVQNLETSAALVGWSRDGKEIALRTSRGLVAVRLDGWLATPLAPSTKGWLAWLETWRGDGALLRGAEDGVHRITIGSGEDRVIIPGLALHPSFLPDGRRFVYTARIEPNSTGNPGGIFLSSLDAPDERRLVLPVRSKAMVASERLLFVRDGTLFSQRFDADTGKVTGDAAPVVDGVTFFHPSGGADFDVGGDTLVYQTPPPDDTPVWLARTGASEGTLGSPGTYNNLRISPDGKHAVVYQRDRRRGTGDLWVHDLARGNAVKLTDDEWSEDGVLWSPDGRSIVYGSDRNGPPDIYIHDVDGNTPPRLVYAGPGIDYPIGWMPDGRLLIQSSQLYKIVGLDGKLDESATGLPTSARRDLAVSPDGRWIASTSAESGHNELYVEPLGRPGPRVQVSVGGGAEPVWSRDGRSLFYVARHTILEAPVRAGASFVSDAPAPVVTLDSEVRDYDVTPDGRRFLVLRAPPRDFLPYQVVVNWQAKAR